MNIIDLPLFPVTGAVVMDLPVLSPDLAVSTSVTPVPVSITDSGRRPVNIWTLVRRLLNPLALLDLALHDPEQQDDLTSVREVAYRLPFRGSEWQPIPSNEWVRLARAARRRPTHSVVIESADTVRVFKDTGGTVIYQLPIQPGHRLYLATVHADGTCFGVLAFGPLGQPIRLIVMDLV